MKSLARMIGFSLIFACTPNIKDSSPARVLENYIQISFQSTSLQDKKRMEELLTGDTKLRLQAWSDEQFTKSFLGLKRKFLGLKILESKKVSDHEVALTYELTYEEGPLGKSAQITQRKLSNIVFEANVWKIKEVRSIRESIEFLEELGLP